MRLESFNPFDVCFNLLKIKYKDYDEDITNKKFLQQYDKVNVFISVETVLKYLSMIQDLEKKLFLQPDFGVILASNFLNLAAHYKRFFINNGLDTRVYLYMTDFESTEFSQNKYTEDYRSYYLIKYNRNPKFVYLTDNLKAKIFPNLKKICDCIPNVHFISSNNVEGSLIPLIISDMDKTRKNFIITSECYETQYSLIPNFMVSCIKRSPASLIAMDSVPTYLAEMTKKKVEDIEDVIRIFNNYGMYCTLLSVAGDRSRSINGITGYGPSTLATAIKDGVNTNNIQTSSTNPNMISSLFKEDDIKKEFINNYYSTNLQEMYKELTESDKLSVANQIINQFDVNSLQILNNTEFKNYPLILEALLL